MLSPQNYETLYRFSEQFLQQRGFISLDSASAQHSGHLYDVVSSVHGIAMHRQLMRGLPRLQWPDTLSQRIYRWLQGESALSIARDASLNLPPVSVLRNLLVGLLSDATPGNVGRLIDNPSAILEKSFRYELTGGQLNPDISRLLLVRLQCEVLMAIDSDPQDSPYLRDVKTWSGEEHEWRLEASMLSLGISSSHYFTQDDLVKHWRSCSQLGRPTPDLLLKWPIAIPCPHGGAPRCTGCAISPATSAPCHLISWIDSKASFAYPSALNHDDSKYQIGRQVGRYCSTFGPGLVIFWGGYVESVPESSPFGVVVHNRPPKEGAWRWATAEEKAMGLQPQGEGILSLFLSSPPTPPHAPIKSKGWGKMKKQLGSLDGGLAWETIMHRT